MNDRLGIFWQKYWLVFDKASFCWEDTLRINVLTLSILHILETKLLCTCPCFTWNCRKEDDVLRKAQTKLLHHFSNKHCVTFINYEDVFCILSWCLLELLFQCTDGKPLKVDSCISLCLLIFKKLLIMFHQVSVRDHQLDTEGFLASRRGRELTPSK